MLLLLLLLLLSSFILFLDIFYRLSCSARPADFSPGVMTRTQPRPPVVLYMMSAFQVSLQPNYIICGLQSKRVVAIPTEGACYSPCFNQRHFSSGISWLQPKTLFKWDILASTEDFSRAKSLLQPKTRFKEEIVASKKTSSLASAEGSKG